jgi:hypothetical protein
MYRTCFRIVAIWSTVHACRVNFLSVMSSDSKFAQDRITAPISKVFLGERVPKSSDTFADFSWLTKFAHWLTFSAA